MDIPDTPRRPSQRGLTSPRVRRNLSFDFDESEVGNSDGSSSPARTLRSPDVDTPDVNDIPHVGQRTPGSSYGCETTSQARTTNSRITGNQYKGFILKWILVLVCLGSCVGILYHRYPNHVIVCFTKEFIVLGTLVILLLITCSLVVKLLRNPMMIDMVQNMSQGLDVLETPSREYGEQSTRNDISLRGQQVPLKRTFSGTGKDIWSEYIRYFENVADLNGWTPARTLRIFFTVLRGQAEVYAYGLNNTVKQDWDTLKNKMDDRFGHRSMKESYVAEAKLRKRKTDESYRDFAQTMEDLYRRAYPNNREYVEESSLKTFLNNCHSSDNFRLAVKRMRPKTLQEAVTFAMQEECILLGEKRNAKDQKRSVYNVQNTSSAKQPGNGSTGKRLKCFECGSEEHLRNKCPDVKRNSTSNQTNELSLNESRLEQ
ncbi:hypothetical protein CI610_03041 [invertebrate metagenome]|uniref:CCHC-type domain-containing protein n=1 Tax=invertebrate metagenome TaxID=1711999 RepID=A0A2H9T497_9ZZZZ